MSIDRCNALAAIFRAWHSALAIQSSSYTKASQAARSFALIVNKLCEAFPMRMQSAS
jgi:hypothetical protein